jgi:hypothetical protein
VSACSTSARWRDTVFATCLALVLGLGVLGVLLLNTSIQQRAQAMARSHERLSTLTGQLQELRAGLDWASNPAALAARAHELRLRPVQKVDYLRLPGARVKVSGRSRGAGQARGG